MPDYQLATVFEEETVAERVDFSSLEWLVIAIGARDGSAPLHRSPFGRSLLNLFGVSGEPRPLASPCLESLRHMADAARRRGWGVPVSDVEAFLRSGWSEGQFELLVETVRQRGDDPLQMQPGGGAQLGATGALSPT